MRNFGAKIRERVNAYNQLPMKDFEGEYKKKILEHKNFPRTPRGPDGKFFIPNDELFVVGAYLQTAYLKGFFTNNEGKQMYYFFYIDKERNLARPSENNLIIGTKFVQEIEKSNLSIKHELIETSCLS